MNVEHGGNIFAISRERGWDWREVLDFSASINPLGPSRCVLAAIRASLDRIVHYPERESPMLRQALASVWSVAPDRILLGNGATELIHFFARLRSFDEVTLGVPVFSEFHRAFPSATCVSVDGDWPRSGLVVLTQPLNPTGCLLALDDYLQETDHPLLIDESFLDFTGEPSAARWLDRRPNLYVLRSLTKFYALPGLRIGALLAGSDEIARLRRLREPWQVNALAEQSALAALADAAHSARTLEYVATERDRLTGQMAALDGVHPQPSRANYLLVALDYPAASLVDHLLERRILVRDCSGWPGLRFASAVRVAVRTREENERLLAAWQEYSCTE